MELWQFITLILVVILFGIASLVAIFMTRKRDDGVASLLASYKADNERALEYAKAEISSAIDIRIQQMENRVSIRQDGLSKELSLKQDALVAQMTEKQIAMNSTIAENTIRSETRFKTFHESTANELNSMRETIERRLNSMQEDNGRRIEEMRGTVDKRLDEVKNVVDEKLQKTLNERITESFRVVNERLSEVYRGLGEMKTLAVGVGDLKKVLTNVKTRGTLGEIQLGAILEDILTSDQYVKNFDVKMKGNERVEYAVRLPNDGDTPVYIPIDSKFPADAYIKLTEAYETADSVAVSAAQKNLRDTIIKFAKDIRDKYIDPPRTTDFAIMFLPTEGIYAEVVRMGMIETLQRDARVNIAGPSTMAALLNSLRMGFSISAMQKRSAEAWQVLGAVKAEFQTFENVLLTAQKRINSANDELEKLIGTRTRMILRKLKSVESLPVEDALPILSSGDDEV